MLKFIKYLFIILCLSGCSLIETDKIGLRTGVAYTDLKYQPDQIITPVRVVVELQDPSNLLNGRFGRIQPTLELIGDTFIYPESGNLIGLCPLIKYTFDLNERLSFHVLAGAGPTYLSLDTFEQGQAGFNFIDQIGTGLEFDIGEFELDIDYRFSHISHANLRKGNNNGIDTHAVLLGIRFPF